MNILTQAARAVRKVVSPQSDYTVCLARDETEIRAAQALRFTVFNLELHEGLPESFFNGLDADPFDAVCDHLLVAHRATGNVVGTYRLQTGQTAARRLGYYCEREFEFDGFEPIRHELIELGRACIHADHRHLAVLSLLWQGVADYARERGARYLCGCSSLTSIDPTVAASAYQALWPAHQSPPPFHTHPTPAFACALDQLHPTPVKIPKLLRAYLGLGAWICGPPALDREFSTIDFLTLLDLDRLSPVARARFLR